MSSAFPGLTARATSTTPRASIASYTNLESAPGKQLRWPLRVPPPLKSSPLDDARSYSSASAAASSARRSLGTTSLMTTNPWSSSARFRSTTSPTDRTCMVCSFTFPRSNRRSRRDPPVDGRRVLGHALDREALLDPASPVVTHALAQLRIVQQREHVPGEGVDVAGRREQPAPPVLDDLRRAAVVERHDRTLHRHRLEVDEPERFVERGHRVHIRRRE